MLLLLQYTLIFAAVLLLVALGGCFSEHSGVINIGLEGIMVMGALGGALVMKFMPYDSATAGFGTNFGMFICVALASIAAGMIFSLLLAVACINFKADQTIIGTAMNLLGTATATVIVKSMNTAMNPDDHSSEISYFDAKNAFVTNIGGEFELNWFVIVAVLLLIVSFILLYKTRFGLRLRACGEHPQAADSVGINVYKMRYAGVLLSGLLGGLGGITYITAGVSVWKFEVGVAGFGFLSLAVMIFGAWDPFRIAGAAVLFGLFRALGNVYNGIVIPNAAKTWLALAIVVVVAAACILTMIFVKRKEVRLIGLAALVLLMIYVIIATLVSLGLPSAVYNMLPYIVSLIVLAFTSKTSRAPKAEGIPYDKGQR